MQYYKLIKAQDKKLYELLVCYSNSFNNIVSVCGRESSELLHIFSELTEGRISKEELGQVLGELIMGLSDKINSGFSEKLLLDKNDFDDQLYRMVEDKFIRTAKITKGGRFHQRIYAKT